MNARYSRDSNHPNFLTPDRQELHFLGRPGHLRVMRELGAQARVICVHGREDSICPFADAEEFSANARAAGLNIETCFVGPDLLDGTVFTSTGHTLGDRTRIVQQVAGRYLTPGVESALSRKGPTDFERREVIRYPTLHGTYVIDYQDGIPVGRYESAGK